MRKLILFMHVSLDGFVAGPTGEMDWIKVDDEIFDFGGGAVRGQYYGPAKFKEKFRGELVEFGRHRFIPNPLIYKSAEKFYKIYSRN